MSPMKRLLNWERTLRAHYNVDPHQRENRRRAEIYNDWFDHAILRRVWNNFHQIAPGVYRSNHPNYARLEKLKTMGINTVINLRGSSNSAHFWTEQMNCKALGLTLINCRLSASKTVPRERLQAVIHSFRNAERPFVMHCKSGADRAGFISAIYLMVIEGCSVEVASKMLAKKYLHLKFTKTGVLDYILQSYQVRKARAPISFEDWLASEYDHVALQEAFDTKKPIKA